MLLASSSRSRKSAKNATRREDCFGIKGLFTNKPKSRKSDERRWKATTQSKTERIFFTKVSTKKKKHHKSRSNEMKWKEKQIKRIAVHNSHAPLYIFNFQGFFNRKFFNLVVHSLKCVCETPCKRTSHNSLLVPVKTNFFLASDAVHLLLLFYGVSCECVSWCNFCASTKLMQFLLYMLKFRLIFSRLLCLLSRAMHFVLESHLNVVIRPLLSFADTFCCFFRRIVR